MWPENVVFAKRLSARYVKLKYEDALFILARRNQIDLNTVMHFDQSLFRCHQYYHHQVSPALGSVRHSVVISRG